MKILATSDLHGRLPEVEPCDLLIIAGDVCPDFYTDRRSEQAAWLDTTFRRWLEDVPAEFVVGIAGNHDFVFETDMYPRDLRWEYLLDDGLEIEGLKLWGSPWVPNLPKWAFHLTDTEADGNWKMVPEDLDILISHGPPVGYGDLVGERFGDVRVGCKYLERAIRHERPKVVICGHIHEGYGFYRHREVPVDIYNVAHNDERYNPINPVVEIAL